eukprot:178381-Prymnesium_polylepis.1
MAMARRVLPAPGLPISTKLSMALVCTVGAFRKLSTRSAVVSNSSPCDSKSAASASIASVSSLRSAPKSLALLIVS